MPANEAQGARDVSKLKEAILDVLRRLLPPAKPASGDVPVYETCEIQLARRPDNHLSLFIAEGISPSGPAYVGASSTFWHANDVAEANAHRELIKYLTDETAAQFGFHTIGALDT